ncbi:amidase [uncultured Maritimibacter sp.]|jgi:aspartyl-tRNA(Asn)/glutamyl-tRNA(Gln) amidotransferase subunit A|uniref:amidase n=1 Tax=uncultured Maritimibacter sp. TaxID=991866 RepID=UPI000A910F95|nr:amidase family protein [uncultured Maritimibacter sp.]
MDDRWKSAGDIGRGIAAGAIDPVALTESYLDAIDTHEHGPRIYARATRDRALTEAKAAAERAKSGQRLGPLDGVPVSWKDLFDTAGVDTAAGSALLAGRVPDTDAEVLRTATFQGLVCLGKTHMSELAFSGLGLNPVTATPPNVHDAGNAPGGSSSGAATSVAFGLAAAGIGSDTGGSVRVPSAWNDLVGLKTTSGRLSLAGVVPLAARFDTVGPLCRTVEDAALLLAALEGKKPVDLTEPSLTGTRLLVLTNALEGCRDLPRDAFESAVGRLMDNGATIERAAMPMMDEAQALSPILFAAEAYGTWRDTIEANPEVMFPPVLERFRGGKAFSGPDYVAAWLTLGRIRAQFARAVAGYDAVILPTTPNTPPNVERLMSDSEYYVTENLLTLHNTRFGNLSGGCALTLPTGVPGAGISFMAPAMGEERLLRLGAAAESALR